MSRGIQAIALVAGKGLGLKAGVIGVLVALVGIIFLAPFASMGESEVAAGTVIDPCAVTVPIGTVPAPLTGSALPEQVEIAKKADAVATAMNMPGQAVLIILMTGLQESGISNISFGDRDSVGWLQQRTSQGWGTVDQIMDPAYGAQKFYEALRGVAGWVDMEYTVAAQAVQRSAFPDAYAKHEQNARNIASAAGIDLTRAGEPYGAGVLAPLPAPAPGLGTCAAPAGPNPDGTWPLELATVCPDPTNGKGCVTPRTVAIVGALQGVNAAMVTSGAASWNQITCWDPHAWNPSSDHPRGKACDLGYGPGFAAGAKLAAGDQMAAWMIQNAAVYGVNYIIWQGKIWFAKTGTWAPYTGGGVYDSTSASGGHYDHVHVSVY